MVSLFNSKIYLDFTHIIYLTLPIINNKKTVNVIKLSPIKEKKNTSGKYIHLFK